MRSGLPLRTPHHHRYQVREHLVPHVLGAGTQLAQHGEPVLASAFLLAFLEDSCWRALAEYREPDETIVGTHFELEHLAPSIPGEILDITALATDLHAHATRPHTDVTWRIEARVPRLSGPVAVLRHRLRVLPTSEFRQRMPQGVSAA